MSQPLSPTTSQPLDHPVIVCKDLDAAARQWLALGFTLTPRGFHSVGSENHCVMLQHEYFELLQVSEAVASLYYDWHARLDDGCAALSCLCDDATAASAQLRRDGWHASGPIDLARPVRLEDGTEHEARFRITAVDDVPGGRFFLCEHRTRELVWRPEAMTHANGAQAVQTVFLVVAPSLVEPACRAYAELTGGSVLEFGEHLCRLSLGTPTLVITTPQRLAIATGTAFIQKGLPGYAAFRVRTASLSQAREVWRAAGIPSMDLGPRETLIPATAASGVALLFEQAD